MPLSRSLFQNVDWVKSLRYKDLHARIKTLEEEKASLAAKLADAGAERDGWLQEKKDLEGRVSSLEALVEGMQPKNLVFK